MSNKLYETRVLRRISQYVIAFKTGIQQSRISLIENELVIPREDEKEKIANVLNVTARELFGNAEQHLVGRILIFTIFGGIVL